MNHFSSSLCYHYYTALCWISASMRPKLQIFDPFVGNFQDIGLTPKILLSPNPKYFGILTAPSTNFLTSKLKVPIFDNVILMELTCSAATKRHTETYGCHFSRSQATPIRIQKTWSQLASFCFFGAIVQNSREPANKGRPRKSCFRQFRKTKIHKTELLKMLFHNQIRKFS